MIGQKLKSARHNLRYNQEEMAHELNTNGNHYHLELINKSKCSNKK